MPGFQLSSFARLLPRGLLAGAALGFALAFVAPGGGKPASGGWGGDFPAFHTAGRIVATGRAASLYDLAVQKELESELLDEGFLAFLYPPFVAAAYAPLALLPYRTAYLVFSVLSAAALVAGVRLLGPMLALVRRDPWTAVAAAALFYPMLRSTLGGQNTAFSFLIVCGAWRAFHARRDLVAGLVLGLLAFKPQYLLPLAGVAFLAGRRASALGAAATVLVLYGLGAWVSGPDWPVSWWSAVGPFAATDREINGINSISAERLTQVLGLDAWWVVPAAALSAWAAWKAWTRGRADFDGVFAFVVVAALLISPHAMYYDLGLAAAPLLLVADRGRPWAALVLWCAGPSHLLAVEGWPSPLVGVTLVLLALVGAAAAPGTEGGEGQSTASASRTRRSRASSSSVA